MTSSDSSSLRRWSSGLEAHLDRVVDERARPDAEHGAPARHVVELHHAAGDRERVVVGQRDDAGAEPDVARALGGGGDEHLGAGDDLEAGRVVLADPGLVVVEPVEMDQQLHVALERQQRVLVQGMEGREEDAGSEIPVLHPLAFLGLELRDGSRVRSIDKPRVRVLGSTCRRLTVGQRN